MWLIFQYQLIYYFKSKLELTVISYFIVALALLANFSFPAQAGVPEGVGPMVLWLGIVCAAQLTSANSWQRHSEQGDIAIFQLLPWALEWTVLGKLLGLYLISLVPILLLLPIAGLWLGMDEGRIAVCMAGLAVGGLALNALNQLVAGLMAGRRTNGAILGVITLPFSIPIIIAGTAYTAQTQLWDGGLLFLIGYGLLLVPITCMAVAASLKASH